jgi:purine-binding chemotaxis protein CheW
MRPLASPAVSASVAQTVQLCAFFVGTEEYAVDIMRIDEILQPQKVTAVRTAPDFVLGVMNLRGNILPVVDLRRRLGAGAPPPRLKPKFLVCLFGRRRIAFAVDGVTEVLRVARASLKPTPGLTAAAHPYVVGVAGTPERMRLLLDLKALLT